MAVRTLERKRSVTIDMRGGGGGGTVEGAWSLKICGQEAGAAHYELWKYCQSSAPSRVQA